MKKRPRHHDVFVFSLVSDTLLKAVWLGFLRFHFRDDGDSEYNKNISKTFFILHISQLEKKIRS